MSCIFPALLSSWLTHPSHPSPALNHAVSCSFDLPFNTLEFDQAIDSLNPTAVSDDIPIIILKAAKSLRGKLNEFGQAILDTINYMYSSGEKPSEQFFTASIV